MKLITNVLICSVGLFLLLSALQRIASEAIFFTSPSKGEVVETWESTDTPFKIRVNKHIEKGGFLAGAYYDFQSAADSNSWREIMTFRHDDPIDIPQNKIYVGDENVVSVFMGWMYAVTTDGGANWRVAKISDFLPANEKCLYNCIESLQIDGNGTGEANLNIIASPYDKLKILETKDFGKTWKEKN